MHRRPWIILIPVIVLLAAAAAWLIARGAFSFGPSSASALTGSGQIQAEEYLVASDTAARVIALTVDEGDTVVAGQAMARLDPTLLAAQVDQANAGLAAAQASLAKLRAGSRPEEIAQARAALAQAAAQRDGAKTALADAQASRSNPQDLNMRIDAARAASAAADHRASAANLLAQSASLERSYYQRTLTDVEGGITIQIPTPRGVFTKTLAVRTEALRTQLALSAAKEWDAWSAQNSAFSQRDGARADLANLLDMKKEPLVLNAQVDAAQAQLNTAQAAVQAAQAKLNGMTAGPRPEDIAAAEAQVQQAQKARDALQAQLDKLTLAAPHAGIVSERLLHLGEMAVPGDAVFHVVDLDTVTLTIYIPEDQIGRVRLGEPAAVTVDTFPGRTFSGVVDFISPQAEFTPKSIATKDQRSSEVFGVKIRLENSNDHALKPGMPADATLL